MKIVFTTHDLALGGSESALVHEANGLAGRGHEVFVVPTIKHQRNDLAPRLQVPLVQFYFNSMFDVMRLAKLIRWLWHIRPDAVVSCSLFSTTIFKFAKLFSPRFRFVVRESNILVRHSAVSKLFDRSTRWMVDAYFTNCETIKRDLIRNIGVSDKKISVIRNGIDPEYFNISKIHHDQFTVLHVGSMSTKQKGQEYLIEAVRDLDVAVLFVGDGHRKPALQKLAQNNQNVKFLGRQKPPYDQADLFVFPSLWEGMPNAVLEAMAAGVPVIATPVGGIPEVIINQVSGIMVPQENSQALTEAIDALQKKPVLRESLAKRAREIVSQPEFTWEHHIVCLEKLITI